MGHLYLVDKPLGEAALAIAREDRDARIVLIQDGVYLDVAPIVEVGVPVFAVKRDLELRGLAERIPGRVKQIDYGELVDLIVDNKVVNFA